MSEYKQIFTNFPFRTQIHTQKKTSRRDGIRGGRLVLLF
jgi:hypothetical protein